MIPQALLAMSATLTVLQDAPAEEPAGQGGLFGGNFLIPMVLIIGIFYIVLILPERKKQKAREAMLGDLKKGDKVMTTSGLLGNVAQVQENVVTLQVADGVRLRFTRSAIQNILNPEEEEATVTQ